MERTEELAILLDKVQERVLSTAKGFANCPPKDKYNDFHLNLLERAIENYKSLKEEYHKLNISNEQKPEHGD